MPVYTDIDCGLRVMLIASTLHPARQSGYTRRMIQPIAVLNDIRLLPESQVAINEFAGHELTYPEAGPVDEAELIRRTGAAGEANYRAFKDTPHVVFSRLYGGYTIESKQRLGQKVLENLRGYFN